jgi:hypothetical protein
MLRNPYATNQLDEKSGRSAAATSGALTESASAGGLAPPELTSAVSVLTA